MKKVLLIGCGDWAFSAHIPAIRANQNIQLIGIIDLSKRRDKVLNKLEISGVDFYSIADACDSRAQAATDLITDSLKKLEDDLPDDIDGVIISTYGLGHYPYIKWALSKRWHTLVDKPLTIVEDMAIDPSKAPILVNHFTEFVNIAEANNLLFMIATQKRYSDIYNRIAQEVMTAQKLCKYDINSIQAFTSDGYFRNIIDCNFPAYGSKIKNTGYHILDIVPWIIRHTNPAIDTAIIQTSPLNYDRLAKIRNIPSTGISQSEAYASMQITFLDGLNSRCIFQFHAQHEGFSMKGRKKGREYSGPLEKSDIKKAYEGRTKEEEMRISLGPYLRIYYRRVAKIYDKDGVNLGENNHLFYEISKSYPGVIPGDEYKYENIFYTDPESMPTEEFLLTLNKSKPSIEKVRSPVSDHIVSIKLFAGVYESMAKAYNGNYEPVYVKFKPKEWGSPP